jgi:hypothetical protein
MRFRSVATVVALSGLFLGALVRCGLPDLPPGPQALPTRVGLARGAILALPAGPIDRRALVASLKELKFTTVILQTTADRSGEFVNDRVALAVELQRELDADVFLGTYQSDKHSGRRMEDLLERDPSFATCYSPGGLTLDADTRIVDKIRLCSQDVSRKIVEALRVAGASPRIGCYISHQPELTSALTSEGRTKLEELFRDSAGPCSAADRFVGVSPLLTPFSGDPAGTGVFLREALKGSGVNVVMLQDGVGTFKPLEARRAAPYYQGLRNALADRLPLVAVWANVEAFTCESPNCVRTHPTTTARFTEQLCAARQRVEGIVAIEYFDDLAGPSLDASIPDASTDAQGVLDDRDAAAQLRRGYLDWTDAGARCP